MMSFDKLTMARSRAGTVLFIASTLQAERVRVLIGRRRGEATQFLSIRGWGETVRAVSVACQAGRKGSAVFLPESVIVDMQATDTLWLCCAELGFRAECVWGTGGPEVKVNYIPELQAVEPILPEVPVLADVLEAGPFEADVVIGEARTARPVEVEAAIRIDEPVAAAAPEIGVEGELAILEREEDEGGSAGAGAGDEPPRAIESYPWYDEALREVAPEPEEREPEEPGPEKNVAAQIVAATAYAPRVADVQSAETGSWFREKLTEMDWTARIEALRLPRLPQVPQLPKFPEVSAVPRKPLAMGVGAALLLSAAMIWQMRKGAVETPVEEGNARIEEPFAQRPVVAAEPIRPAERVEPVPAEREIDTQARTEPPLASIPAAPIEEAVIEVEREPVLPAGSSGRIEPASPTPVPSELRLDVAAEDVAQAQTYLAALDLYTGEIDGKFGGQTLQAVEGFRVLYGAEVAAFDADLVARMGTAVAAREALDAPVVAPSIAAETVFEPERVAVKTVVEAAPIVMETAPVVPINVREAVPLYSDPIMEALPEPVFEAVPDPVPVPQPILEPASQPAPQPASEPVIVSEQLIQSANLTYPNAALRSSRVPDDVSVVVRYDVDASGTPVNAQAISRSYTGPMGESLEAAAVEAIYTQKYTPRREDGLAVPVTGVQRTLRFRKD
jgi:hypothetical protein